jgi:hypothetical protein
VAYATLAELRAYVGIPVADTADDVTLTLALDAASAQIDAYCGRSFTLDGAVVDRDYSPATTAAVDIDPIGTLTGLVVKTDDNDDGTFETTWTIGTDFRAEPINAAALGVPWTRLVATGTKAFPTTNRYYPGLRVTAKYGWGASVPAAVKQAALLLGMKLFKRKDAPFGVAGSMEFGSEVRILPGDMDAERLLNPYRRSWVVV